MSCEILHQSVGTTGLLTVTITDADGEFVNDAASCEVTVVDADGVEVEGETWPLAMAYVASSDGQYQAVLVHDLEWSENAEYSAIIEAVGQNGYHVKRKVLIVTDGG